LASTQPERHVVYTDGVRYLAEKVGAFWLIDEIVLNQIKLEVRDDPFQVWKLTVNADKTAKLVCRDGGDGTPDLFVKNIEWTDFPLDEISIWFIDNTILLPSEY